MLGGIFDMKSPTHSAPTKPPSQPPVLSVPIMWSRPSEVGRVGVIQSNMKKDNVYELEQYVYVHPRANGFFIYKKKMKYCIHIRIHWTEISETPKTTIHK